MEQNQPNELEVLRDISFRNTTQLYPRATKKEVEKYVEEFTRFVKFLMDKYNKSVTNVSEIIIDALEQSMVENEKQQEEISKELELVINGHNPNKVFDNEDLESVSACMRKLAIYHEYPHVDELIEANKILERYLIGR